MLLPRRRIATPVPEGDSQEVKRKRKVAESGANVLWACYSTALTDADTVHILPRGQRSRGPIVTIDRPVVPGEDRRGRSERHGDVRARRSVQ